MKIKNQVYPTAEQVGAAAATHASQHASGGSDPITPADIGALPLSAGVNYPLTGNLYLNNQAGLGGNSNAAIIAVYNSDKSNARQLVLANTDYRPDKKNILALKDEDGAVRYIYGEHNQTTPVDSTPTVAKIRSSSLNSTETTPSLNGQIAWTYE